MLLAGDIGGTKSNLAIIDPELGPRTPVAEETLSSSAYPNLRALLHDFVRSTGAHITTACLGVAGPVIKGRATITNLSWTIDQEALRQDLRLNAVCLLNDLVSIAYALPLLAPGDLHTLNPGTPQDRGTAAVIAPGTGLGEAFLTWAGQCYQAHASEGGHADFAPNSALERGLIAYLAERHGHVSYERVCSGLGLPNIYAYLRDSGYAPEPNWLARELAQATDPTPVIVNTALDAERQCELSVATLQTFVSILAAEAGNLALRVMATGGVFLGGGIPPRILPALCSPTFMCAFCNKGRLADMMLGFPVHVILNPKAPLIGAAAYGLQM